MKPHLKILFVLVALVAAATGLWLARSVLGPSLGLPFGPRPEIPLERGTRLAPPRPIPEFALLSHDGLPLRRDELKGRWSLMFFGFTHCPGVCPITLGVLTDVSRRLESLPAAKRPRIVFVSVDPERDTPEVMKQYLQAFKAPILGITGSPKDMDTFAQALGIAHGKIPMEGDDYMVDHTSVVIVLDEQARQAAVFSEPFEAVAIANDYLRMLGRIPERTPKPIAQPNSGQRSESERAP